MVVCLSVGWGVYKYVKAKGTSTEWRDNGEAFAIISQSISNMVTFRNPSKTKDVDSLPRRILYSCDSFPSLCLKIATWLSIAS